MTETDDQCPNYGIDCFAHNGVEEFGGLCGSCWTRLSNEDQNSIRSALGARSCRHLPNPISRRIYLPYRMVDLDSSDNAGGMVGDGALREDKMTQGESALWGVSLGVAISATSILGYHIGYGEGQKDALEGKWSYQRVVTEDGVVKYIQLDKPVIRKVETKP